MQASSINVSVAPPTASLGQSQTQQFSATVTRTANIAVTGTADPALYQAERYGAFQYQFTVPAGSYTVKLKYAEIFFNAAGQRKFNVNINGAAVQTNFDVAAAGGGAFKAIDLTFPISS